METDAELVRRCLRGETSAFGTLAERHRASASRFCYGQLGDFDAAEDLAQEAFLRAYFDLHALREPERFGAWLRAIALRLCQSWHRRRREDVISIEAMECETRAAAREVMARSEARSLAEEALAQLTEAQRRVVMLKHWSGYSLAEIAAITQVPIETVRTRLRRARLRLQSSGIREFEETKGESSMKRREFLEKTGAVSAAAVASGVIPAAASAVPSDAAFARRVLERLNKVHSPLAPRRCDSRPEETDIPVGIGGRMRRCLKASLDHTRADNLIVDPRFHSRVGSLWLMPDGALFRGAVEGTKADLWLIVDRFRGTRPDPGEEVDPAERVQEERYLSLANDQPPDAPAPWLVGKDNSRVGVRRVKLDLHAELSSQSLSRTEQGK